MPLPQWDNPPLTPGSFSSKLPDPGALFGAAPIAGIGVPDLWGRRAVEGMALLSGYFLQNIALDGGWTDPIDILDNAADTGLLNVGQRIWSGVFDPNDPNLDPLHIAQAVFNLLQETGLLRAALDMPLQQLQMLISEALGGLIASTAEIMPIIGWAISLIRGTVLASRTVKENSDRGYGILPGTIEGQQQGIVPSFNRARNDDAANVLLEVLKGGDWTEVWMPSTAPWSKLALDRNGNGNIDGWILGAGLTGGLATDIPMPAGVWAAIPGMAQLGGAYYGFIDGDKVDTRSISDMYPSVNQLAGMAWTRMQMISGQCCNVRLKKIKHAWGIWQGKAREFLETESMRPSGDIADEIKMARVMVDAARGSPYHDGKPFRTNLYPGGPRRADYIADRVRAACDKQRDRIWQLLGTIACAYVPPDAPALQDDAELRLRYAAMRAKLLEHPARWLVERNLVPDQAYRQMLFDATVGSTFSAPGVLPKVGGSIDGGREPDPPKLPDVPDGVNGETSGGGGGMLVGLVVAAVLVFLFMRGRK